MTGEEIENYEMITELAEDYKAKVTVDYISEKNLYIIKFVANQMLGAKLKESGGTFKEASEKMLENIKKLITHAC